MIKVWRSRRIRLCLDRIGHCILMIAKPLLRFGFRIKSESRADIQKTGQKTKAAQECRTPKSGVRLTKAKTAKFIVQEFVFYDCGAIFGVRSPCFALDYAGNTLETG